MALAALTVVYVALFAYYLHATIIRPPYWDMYSYIVRYLQYRGDGSWWAYLWEPHVQHRQIWMRLLTALDVELFAGVAYPFIVFAVVCHALTAWLLWREVRSGFPGAEPRAIGCLTLMLVLTSVSAVDCAIPMNGIYPQFVGLSVCAFILFDAGDNADEKPGADWRRIAAFVAAVAAAFANAAALIVWPILAWLAWRSGAGRRWIAAVAACGLAFAAVYLYRLPSAAEGDGSLFRAMDLAGLRRTVGYLITYMGLPWTRSGATEILGKLLGAFLFAAGTAAVVWRGFIVGSERRVERLALALVAFTLATAVLASVGRSDLEADLRVPVRYSVLVAPLHVGLLVLVWPFVTTLLANRPRLRAVAMNGVGLLFVVQQVVAGQAAAATTRSMRATIDRFIAGEESEEMKTVVFVDLGQARRDWNAISAAGLYQNTR